MQGKHKPSFILVTGGSSGGSAVIPLPTAYGYSSSFIPVIDYMSVVYSATATSGAASASGGWMRVNVRVNGTSNTFNVLNISSPIVGYLTGSASSNYVLMGAVELNPFNGVPLWARDATTGLTDTGAAVTSTQIQINTGGTLPASDNVEYNIVFHYENPAERR